LFRCRLSNSRSSTGVENSSGTHGIRAESHIPGVAAGGA
jgi:hypothetical protein